MTYIYHLYLEKIRKDATISVIYPATDLLCCTKKKTTYSVLDENFSFFPPILTDLVVVVSLHRFRYLRHRVIRMFVKMKNKKSGSEKVDRNEVNHMLLLLFLTKQPCRLLVNRKSLYKPHRWFFSRQFDQSRLISNSLCLVPLSFLPRNHDKMSTLILNASYFFFIDFHLCYSGKKN